MRAAATRDLATRGSASDSLSRGGGTCGTGCRAARNAPSSRYRTIAPNARTARAILPTARTIFLAVMMPMPRRAWLAPVVPAATAPLRASVGMVTCSPGAVRSRRELMRGRSARAAAALISAGVASDYGASACGPLQATIVGRSAFSFCCFSPCRSAALSAFSRASQMRVHSIGSSTRKGQFRTFGMRRMFATLSPSACSLMMPKTE